MATTNIRRRLGNLEMVLRAMPAYPPFTRPEIAEVDRRVRAGEMLTPAELLRLERHTPIVEGELLITCYGGNLFIKRYLGVDLAEV
jgi:hypothetical protein